MRKFIPLFLALLFLPVAILGCKREAPPHNHKHEGKKKISVSATHKGERPIKVVCTTGMIADVVRNIGGDLVKIEQLMGEGVDPHLFKVTSADVAKMSDADVLFYSGLHLEGKMTDALERLALKKPVLGVADYLDPKAFSLDDEKQADPHVWFDVSLWSEVAGVIGESLGQYDPTNAAMYAKKTESYRADLAKLHDEAKKKIAEIQPKEKRVLVTSHDAFRYFGRAYDIEVRGIQGISTDAEPSLDDINQLVDFLVKNKVKAVFVESSVNPRGMKSLLEGAKAKGHEVVLGGELFSDAMGKEGTPEGTYIGMIRHNVDTIVKALK